MGEHENEMGRKGYGNRSNYTIKTTLGIYLIFSIIGLTHSISSSILRNFTEEERRIWEAQCSGTHWLLDDLDSVQWLFDLSSPDSPDASFTASNDDFDLDRMINDGQDMKVEISFRRSSQQNANLRRQRRPSYQQPTQPSYQRPDQRRSQPQYQRRNQRPVQPTLPRPNQRPRPSTNRWSGLQRPTQRPNQVIYQRPTQRPNQVIYQRSTQRPNQVIYQRPDQRGNYGQVSQRRYELQKRQAIDQILRDISNVYRRAVDQVHRAEYWVQRIESLNSTRMLQGISFSVKTFREDLGLTRDAVRNLETHTRNLYLNAYHCPRLRRLGRADEMEACNVLILDPGVIKEMQIYFDHRKTTEENSMAHKLLEKSKRHIRKVDQQTEKIKLTRQEHMKIVHHFRGNLAELTHRMSGVEKAQQDTREILHTTKGKIQTAKYLNGSLHRGIDNIILRKHHRRHFLGSQEENKATVDEKVHMAQNMLKDISFHTQSISSRKRHLAHSPRIVQRKVHDLKNSIMMMLEHWLDSRTQSRVVVSYVLGSMRKLIPLVQKAEPFYNYIKALRNITSDLRYTDVFLENSQQTQQEMFDNICLIPTTPVPTTVTTTTPVPQTTTTTPTATTSISTTIRFPWPWEISTVAPTTPKPTTTRSTTTSGETTTTATTTTTSATTTTAEESIFETTTTPPSNIDTTTTVETTTTAPGTTTTTTTTTTATDSETTTSRPTLPDTSSGDDGAKDTYGTTENGGEEDSEVEGEDTPVEECTGWLCARDQPYLDHQARLDPENYEDDELIALKRFRKRLKRSVLSGCAGLGSPHESSLVLANRLRDRAQSVNKTNRRVQTVRNTTLDFRSRLNAADYTHRILERDMENMKPLQLQLDSPKHRKLMDELFQQDAKIRKHRKPRRRNHHSNSTVAVVANRKSLDKRRHLRFPDFEYVADEHNIRHARNKKRGKNRKGKKQKFLPNDFLQIDRSFDSIMKKKNRAAKRARYKARKAVKKTNFVLENTKYLLERVNDTYTQFKTMEDEIMNLPPSREVAAIYSISSEVRSLDYSLFNTHARIRTIADSIRNSIQDVRLKIQHTDRYYQWIQPILPVGRREVIREVPNRVIEPSLVNNLEVTVKTDSETGTILNLVNENRGAYNERENSYTTTRAPPYRNRPRVTPAPVQPTPESNPSISLGVEEGRACLIWNEQGQSRKICGPRVSDNQWHQLNVKRQGDSLQLMVDKNNGRSQYQQDEAVIKLPFSSTLSTLPNKIVFPRQRSENGRSKRDVNPGFTACVTNIALDGHSVDVRDSRDGFNLIDTSSLPNCVDLESLPKLIEQKSHLRKTSTCQKPGPLTIHLLEDYSHIQRISFSYKTQDINSTLLLYQENHDFFVVRIYNGKLSIEGNVKGHQMLRFCYDINWASDSQWHHITLRVINNSTELYVERSLCERIQGVLLPEITSNTTLLTMQPSYRQFNYLNATLPSQQPLRPFHGEIKHLMINNRLVAQEKTVDCRR